MTDIRQTELFCDWLENYLDFERIKKKDAFSLETMQFLVERFKHPERSFKSIHIAGSKGKGSVSTMIASILDAAGMPTGLYTSPHLIDFTERIATVHGPFDDATYGKACDIVVPLVDSIIPGSIPGGADPTWFELVTLFAFETFKEAKLPWAVIETGLGGRLDATNVIMPEACVLTPIELEHTEYLGDTIAKIAGEKAGIIKNSIPVFVSEQHPSARFVFEERAKSFGNPLFSMESAVSAIDSRPSKSGLDIAVSFNALPGGALFSRPIATTLKLVNAIQAKNAALAAYTVKYLMPEVSEATIEKGLASAWLPGRFEIIEENPGLVLDGAHTIRSITLTLETFRSLFPGKAHLLFACAADKAVDDIASLFSEGFSRITVTRPGEKKQSDIDHAARAFSAVFSSRPDVRLSVDPDYESAIVRAMKAAKSEGQPLLVTGSFYLVSEAKKILARGKQDQ